jgi:hypothetical protein
MADVNPGARSSCSLAETGPVGDTDSCRSTTKHHLAKSSVASPVLIVINITDAAIFKLEHEERYMAAGSVSSFALPAATIV